MSTNAVLTPGGASRRRGARFIRALTVPVAIVALGACASRSAPQEGSDSVAATPVTETDASDAAPAQPAATAAPTTPPLVTPTTPPLVTPTTPPLVTPTTPPLVTPASPVDDQAPKMVEESGDEVIFGVYERIDFAPGASSATVSDFVESGTVNGYVLNARAGQLMFIDVSTVERFAAGFELYDPNFELLATPGGSGPNLTEVYTTTGGSFQTEVQLPVDGDYLIVVDADPGDPVSLFVEITSPGASPTTAAPTAPALPPATNACTSYTVRTAPPFGLCDRGDVVADIQRALTTAGFPVEADGFYGPSTEAAVKQLQLQFFGDPAEATGIVDAGFFDFVLFGD